MALTFEVINANASLAGLTDEQKGIIVAMSANDENSVIGQKTGEIYGALDADILAASGIAKNGTEKTYDYAKRAIGEIKAQAGKAEELTKKVADLEAEKSRLEDIVAKGGGDEETKKQLASAKADLDAVKGQYAELNKKYDKALKDHEKALFGLKVDSVFAGATSGLKFKAELPAAVVSVLTEQAVAKVKALNPEFIDDGKGGKVLAFMTDGAVMRNPENNLNPYTAAELVAKELSAMGVLDAGRTQTGAGSQGGRAGGGGGGAAADLSGARTQSEAHEIIARQLMSQGLVNGSKEFDEAMAKTWKENHAAISALPLN